MKGRGGRVNAEGRPRPRWGSRDLSSVNSSVAATPQPWALLRNAVGVMSRVTPMAE